MNACNTNYSKYHSYLHHLEKHIDVYLTHVSNDISINPLVTPEFIENHIDKSWQWGELGLSINPSITCEFIEKHIDKPWHWGELGLSINPSITCEFIEKHIDKPWHWGLNGLSINTSITSAFIQKYNKKPWESFLIEDYPIIPKICMTNTGFDFSKKLWYPDRCGINCNPTLIKDFIENYSNDYSHHGQYAGFHRSPYSCNLIKSYPEQLFNRGFKMLTGLAYLKYENLKTNTSMNVQSSNFKRKNCSSYSDDCNKKIKLDNHDF